MGVEVAVNVAVKVGVAVRVGVRVAVLVGRGGTTYSKTSAQPEGEGVVDWMHAVQDAQVPLLPKISGPPMKCPAVQ